MKTPVISRRSAALPFSPLRKLATLAAAAEERGVHVHRLNIGQSDIPTPKIFFQQLRRACRPVVGYAPSAGYVDITRAWRHYYQQHRIALQEREIVVTTGGSEALLFAMIATCNPNDEVIVFEPLYPNYIPLAAMAQVKLRQVTLPIDRGYHLPARRDIERAITPRTRAILFCNPANPTGTVFTKQEVRSIFQLAVRHNLFIIADETYREMIFDHRTTASFMHFTDPGRRVILADSVSKRFNVCGSRIGCLASRHPDVLTAAVKFAQGRLSAPTLEQLAVVPLLERHERYSRPLKAEYEKRRNTLVTTLRAAPEIEVIQPEGALYAMLKLPIRDSEDFCRWLLEHFADHGETVLVAPGPGFYLTPGQGRQEVRVAYVLARPQLLRALKLLMKALQVYQKN